MTPYSAFGVWLFWLLTRLKLEAGPPAIQQLQKYERGSNRISASKLFEACQALGLKPSVLFGGDEPQAVGEIGEADVKLAASIQALAPAHRRAVVAMIESLAGGPQEPELTGA